LLADDAAKSGRAHVSEWPPTRDMSVFDCVNAADAMVGGRFLGATTGSNSGKPFA